MSNTPTARPRARLWGIALLVSTSTLVAHRASAQDVATSFEQLGRLLKPGDTIRVTETTGRKTTGKLGEVTASSLELLIPKTGSDGRTELMPLPRFSERDVRAIALERRDSLLNGALIGLAAGAGPGIWFIAGRSRGSDPVQHADTALAITLVPGAVGAGIGTLIDALIFQRTTVFLKPRQRSSRLHVLPSLSKSATGVWMSVRF